MKLRNKKTGETWTTAVVESYACGAGYRLLVKRDAYTQVGKHYDTLAELNDEWEDYEESKEFWYISQDGVIFSDTDTITQDYADRLEAIGNYFETKEEAKKALEKLKAWKTLRDNKVHFDLATLADETTVTIFARKKGAIHEYDKELFLLFGEDSIKGENNES